MKMSFNGDGPYNKRMRTDGESGSKGHVGFHRGGDGGFNSSFDNEFENPRRRKGEPDQPNHVILMTIINPAYPITVDVIHTITQPYGNVLRIVIFKKNGVQCMVEYETVDSATVARDALQGADIYSGCCTLRVEYAKPAKLNVYRNDNESWDYTNNQGMDSKPQGPSGQGRPPLLQEPRFGESMPPRGGGLNGGMGGPPPRGGLFSSPGGGDRYGGGMELESWGDDRRGGRDRRGFGGRFSGGGVNNGGARGGMPSPGGLAGAGPYMGGNGGPPNTMGGGMGGPGPNLPQQGAVLMVYGLNKDRMNADRLFNMLCLYGNVVRVKFLKTKEGCAMVQMGDALAVERAIGNLNNTMFFGNKMQLGYSKQAFLADVQQPFDLPDSSPSFKDYMGNKNNRFINPEQASKNRIQPPSKILHFFNTPPNISESAMRDVFMDEDVTPPKGMKLFQSKTDRSSSGLLEFDSISESLEALVTCNHARIPNPTSRFPFVMKLCFSSSRTLNTRSDRMEKEEDDKME